MSHGRVPAMGQTLRLDERHPGRGLAALLGGAVLVVIGILISGPATPSASSLEAIIGSIGMTVSLLGSLLALLGVAYLTVSGRPVTWAAAAFGAILVWTALVVTFAVVPAWWVRSMRDLGPAWAKDLVALVYLGAVFGASLMTLRGPGLLRRRPSGVSAYGRTVVKR
jgi:hypothetical protein